MLDFTNPIVFYLIQNALTSSAIAFAPPHHPARIVTFLFTLVYFYLLFPTYLDRLHYRVLTSIVFGSSCANLLTYLDLVVLSQWSFENEGPIPSQDSRAEAGSKREDIKGQSMTSMMESMSSVSKTGQDETALERFRYGYFINAGTRLIGTSHMVKNVPPYSTSRPSYVPSRAAFLVRKACIFSLCYLFLDLVTSSVDPTNNPNLFSTDKIPLFRRWRDVDAEEVLRKVLGGVAYWVSSYCTMQCYMGAWAFVCVVCGDDPIYWRPNFGSLSEGYSVRRFWGVFWHQHLRRPLSSSASFFTYYVLRLPKHSLIARYTHISAVFLLSGVVHALTEVTAHTGGGEETASMSFRDSQCVDFFLAQALGIMLEDGVQAVARKLGILQGESEGTTRRTLIRLVGWLWTVGFLAWSTPAIMYPAARLSTGKGRDVLLPISVFKLFKKQQ